MPKKFNIARWAWVLGLLLTAAGVWHSAQAKDMSWGAINDANRFQVLQNFGGAAVLDRETGLIWQKSPSSAGVVYSDAQAACLHATTGGRFGWRMPTFEELISVRTTETLITGDDSLALPSGHPFQNVIALTAYWTSTVFPDDTGSVRQISFAKSCDAGGSIVCFQGRSKTDGSPVDPVWCVRGGPGHLNGE